MMMNIATVLANFVSFFIPPKGGKYINLFSSNISLFNILNFQFALTNSVEEVMQLYVYIY